MKIICDSGTTIDLDKFESVRYRTSYLGPDHGYTVEAIRHERGGIFGGTNTIEVEILRLNDETMAKDLQKAITLAWIDEEKVFDVNEWIQQRNPQNVKRDEE